MAPVALHVDMAELARVQQELTTLISALTDLGGNRSIHADDASMGSPDITDAVQRFLSQWSGGRDRILENLQACQRFAAKAVEEYLRTECQLTDAGRGQVLTRLTNGGGGSQ